MVSISNPKILLVEGSHEEDFFRAFLSNIQIVDIQVMQVGGKHNFRPNLETFKDLAGFETVTSLAVFRDADNDYAATLQSVRDAIRNGGLPVPIRPGEMQQGTPNVGIYILPDNSNTGALEDLCIRSVENSAIHKCAVDYLDCVTPHRAGPHPHRGKALVQTYLAHLDQGNIHMGNAAKMGVWDWNSPSFVEIRNFLQLL